MNIVRGKLEGAVKLLIYGHEGIGKSTLASQFPDPLYIDTEGSTRHMDVARTETPSSWTMMMEQVKYICDNPSVCKTLVIDTMDWAEQLCSDHICATKKLSGIEDIGYGKGYVYLAEEFGHLLNQLEEVVRKGINVIVIAHAMMRKFEQPDEMGAYDRWELKMQKKDAALVKEWSDGIFFMSYKTMSVATDKKGKKFKPQGGQRVIYTSHHPCWDAKNRFGMPDELPMSYDAISPYLNLEIARPLTTTNSIPPDPVPAQQPPAPVQEQSNVLIQAPSPQSVAPPEVPRQANSDPAPTTATPSEAPVQMQAKQQDNTDSLRALYDLMRVNKVEVCEIQAAFAARKYYPEQTPLENLPDDFIKGVLIGAWPQVFAWIQANRPILPF